MWGWGWGRGWPGVSATGGRQSAPARSTLSASSGSIAHPRGVLSQIIIEAAPPSSPQNSQKLPRIGPAIAGDGAPNLTYVTRINTAL